MVSHIYKFDDNTDDERIIGVFSDFDRVDLVVEKLKKQVGFRKYAEDFIIEEIELNAILWSSGF